MLSGFALLGYLVTTFGPATLWNPDTWWQSRAGQRVQAIESEKLLVDLLRHPF